MNAQKPGELFWYTFKNYQRIDSVLPYFIGYSGGVERIRIDGSGNIITSGAIYADGGVIGAVPGAGDVVGPAGAGADFFPAFSGTTGKIIKDSGYLPASFATSGHTHTGYAATSHEHPIADLSDWPAGLDTTELSYVDGVTGAIQAQLNVLTDAGGHDAVTVTDTDSVDLTLSGQDISATVLASGISHNSLADLTSGYSHPQYAASGHTHYASGLTGWPSVDMTELGYVDGVTSAIQAQLDGKIGTATTHSRAFVIKAPAATDDFPLFQVPYAITLTAVNAICSGGTNVIGCLDEYATNATTTSGAVDSDWTISTTKYTDTSFSNAGIAAGNWVHWHTTSVSGTVNFLAVELEYTETYT